MAELPSTDRNLLIALLAFQNNFIDRPALLAAFAAWTENKSRPIAELLVEQKKLTTPQRQLIEALATEHLKQHANDPQQSLAALSSVESGRAALATIADDDLQQSLVHLRRSTSADTSPLGVADSQADPDRTMSFSFGANTSTGQRFRILRPHAEGGLGRVSVARDEELNREVALKEIKPKYADEPSARARFTLEAEITGGLEHPGIVPVYGLGTYADGRPYYAMRFIRGQSLEDAIEDFFTGSITDWSAARTSPQDVQAPVLRLPGRAYQSVAFRQLLGRFLAVCNALAYAHTRGVLHRDLKPANIMLGKYGETLVVDWGLAKQTGLIDRAALGSELTPPPAAEPAFPETMMGSMVGSPAYMSPEQAAGLLDQFGPATDIYQLGSTLYHLLVGAPPHTGPNLSEVLRRAKQGTFPTPRSVNAGIPRALEAICLKAMALRPEDRYSQALDLATDIERYLADEAVSASRESWSAMARRWLRKRPSFTGGLAATLLAGLIGVGAGSVLLGQKNHQLNLIATSLQAERNQVQLQTARANAEAKAAINERQTAQQMQAKATEQEQLAAARLQHIDHATGLLAQIFHDFRPATEEVDSSDEYSSGFGREAIRPREELPEEFRIALADRLQETAKKLGEATTTDATRTARLQTELGTCLLSLGFPDGAAQLLCAACQNTILVDGRFDHDAVRTLKLYMQAEAATQYYGRGVEVYEAALSKIAEVSKEDSLDVQALRLALAKSLAGRGELGRALSMFGDGWAWGADEVGIQIQTIRFHSATGNLKAAMPLTRNVLQRFSRPNLRDRVFFKARGLHQLLLDVAVDAFYYEQPELALEIVDQLGGDLKRELDSYRTPTPGEADEETIARFKGRQMKLIESLRELGELLVLKSDRQEQGMKYLEDAWKNCEEIYSPHDHRQMRFSKSLALAKLKVRDFKAATDLCETAIQLRRAYLDQTDGEMIELLAIRDAARAEDMIVIESPRLPETAGPKPSPNFVADFAESERLRNNLIATAKTGAFPKIRASQADDVDQLPDIADQQVTLLPGNLNGWTTRKSKGESDYLEVEFLRLTQCSRIEFALMDEGPAGALRPPQAVTAQYWTQGQWYDVPDQSIDPTTPAAGKWNNITFKPREALMFRLRFKHAPDAKTGVKEIAIWP